MKEFIKLDEYGQLYIDRILFESYFPIIFTCINDGGEIFICVCCQNNKNGCKWLLGKTNGMNIVKMLRDEITIRQLLVEYSLGQISVDYAGNNYSATYHSSDWKEDSPYLPKSDSYMCAEEGEFDEEIAYFSSMIHFHYDAEYYKRLTEKSGIINTEAEPIAQAMTAFASYMGSIVLSDEVYSTLKVFGELRSSIMISSEKYTNLENYKIIYNESFGASAKGLDLEIGTDDINFADAA